MWMFTLAISCLTTSNLPWFMDLTFQVLMPYRSLGHWPLLSPPDMSTVGCHFGFGFISPEIALCGAISPFFSNNIMETYLPGRLIFQCPIFLPFHTVHGVLRTRILKWFAIPFSSGARLLRPRLAEAGLQLLHVAAGHARHPGVHCWSSWVCEPSPGAGYQLVCHPGAWAEVLLELLADADGCWRMPRSGRPPGLSVATGCHEAAPLPRSLETQRAPWPDCGCWPPWLLA